jgi:glutamyl-tRNA reductase
MLGQAEGIEEVIVFSTSNRTEFVIWGDPTLAVNSIQRLLSAEYELKLQEWNSFYRLLDEQALSHAFRVGCGLDSMYIGEGHIARQFARAWEQARNTGCAGRHLDAVLRRSLAVRRRVRKETDFVSHLVTAPVAAIRLAEQIFGSLEHKNVVLFGAGNMAESAAQELPRHSPRSLRVISHNDASARELVLRLHPQASSASAGAFQERWQQIAVADLVISATSAPGFIFTAEDMKRLVLARNETDRKGKNLLLIDLALPRDIDPAVRAFDGVLLYDLEDLERAVEPRKEAPREARAVYSRRDATRDESQALAMDRAGRRRGEAAAEQIVLAEVREFKKELLLGPVSPEVAALRSRLDEICRQELESFRLEHGPFPKDQDRLISTVGLRITHKIAGSLTRDLKISSEPRAAKRMIVNA